VEDYFWEAAPPNLEQPGKTVSQGTLPCSSKLR
jgi:hypothetical protein